MVKKIKVVVNFGHGGPDSGAVGNGLKEKDLTKAIGKRITKLLRDNYDVEVKEIRQSQSGGGLTQITNEANAWGADIFVSIHINSGGGTGFESFIFNGNVSNDTKKLQNAIHDAVIKEINVTDRGKKTANFAVLRQTRMPAVLTENMFIDTKADADKLKDSKFLGKVAQGHVNGIASFLGLKSGSNSKPSKPSKPSINHTKPIKSISTMASEVIAGKHGSGHANRRKSLGISDAQYQKVRAEVNKRAGSNSKPATKKSIEQMADEVLKGQHGNGHNKRRDSLGISQSEYDKVKSEVNKRLMGKPSNEKSISQMATEVINGKHGSGHANRRKSLGISQSEYNKVRAEVNRRL